MHHTFSVPESTLNAFYMLEFTLKTVLQPILQMRKQIPKAKARRSAPIDTVEQLRGKPGMLQFMGSQSVGLDFTTEQQQHIYSITGHCLEHCTVTLGASSVTPHLTLPAVVLQCRYHNLYLSCKETEVKRK